MGKLLWEPSEERKRNANMTKFIGSVNKIYGQNLFAVNGYFYKGKAFSSLANVAEVVKGIPSIEEVVVACYTEEKPDIGYIPESVHYGDFLSMEKGLEIQFERLPFDHPVYIMFPPGQSVSRKEEQIWQRKSG